MMGKSKPTHGDPQLLDFHYAAQVSLCLLKPIGVWPLRQEDTALGTVVRASSIFLATFLQLFMIIPWIVYICTAQCDFYEILRTACPLIFSVTVFLRYLLLLFHQDEIKFCIERVAEDWRNVTLAEDREIMLAYAKSGRWFGMISVSFMFGSGLLYCIVPLVAPPIVSVDNVTIRPFPNPCELLILDAQVNSILTAKFVTHVCGQCEILTYFFDELVDGGDRNQGTIDQRIATAVIYHLRILRFVADVDKVMNEICLAEFLNASSNICLLGYYVIMDWKNQESMLQISTYFLAFISITFNIYIFCHIGEMLVEQCQKVGTKCYAIEWYRLPHNKARSLLFSILMSNYPIELTAGKMLTMTMSSFSNNNKDILPWLSIVEKSHDRARITRMIVRNVYYQKDVRYVLEQTHIVLRVLGIWPLTDRRPTTIEKLSSIFRVIICYFFLNCDLLPGVLYYIFSDDDTIVKVKVMPPILYSIMAITKYSNFLIFGREIRRCLRYVKEDWKTMLIGDARDMMMANASTTRRLFTICCAFMYCGGVSYNTIVPLSRGKIVTDQNVTIRALSSPGYYVFFDPQSSPGYELVFLSQCLCGLVMYTITVTTCGLAAFFVLHACVQMEILMRLMKDLIDESESRQKDVVPKLITIIEHQIRVRNFLNLVETTLRYANLVEIVGCTTIICLVGYCMIGEWEDKNLTALITYVTVLVSVFINIFTLCYIGEYVRTQAEEVYLSFCTLEWYRLPTNVARDMILVIMASSVPPKVTAGSIIDLSLRTFGDVIKSSVVYLNILRQVTE
ncbi:PREDICTED: uncharacterized protein LOC106740661 [Dinoponera quadriceps]|uniref:Uncharacterized protein LOC106740661 n=1 Tax=Dinoponera quadriceps TaxID=609295 RepID=A0A6P3WMS3_DINQU|nr:PREDICTED: uncharacterized protein LOC106740661 [Dinoponera quadriceps]